MGNTESYKVEILTDNTEDEQFLDLSKHNTKDHTDLEVSNTELHKPLSNSASYKEVGLPTDYTEDKQFLELPNQATENGTDLEICVGDTKSGSDIDVAKDHAEGDNNNVVKVKKSSCAYQQQIKLLKSQSV